MSHWEIIEKEYTKFTKLRSFNSGVMDNSPLYFKLFIIVTNSRRKV